LTVITVTVHTVLMTSTLTPDAVAPKVAKLVAAAERASYDPFTEIDWNQPIADTAYFLPPEHLPLFGTPPWEAMSELERIEYSRHECASLCSAGIWFENILMNMVLKHLYDLPVSDVSHRYLLIETADECRHSAMFGEFIRQAGTPAYQVDPLLRFGGKVMTNIAGRAGGFIAILAAEEILDVSNRATMKDDRVHPLSRQIAKLHVLEEARHMSFARTWLEAVWPTLNPLDRVRAAALAPVYVFGIADALVNPTVYDELGIDGGARMAKANPHRKDMVKGSLHRLVTQLEELGAITPLTRPSWMLLGLI